MTFPTIYELKAIEKIVKNKSDHHCNLIDAKNFVYACNAYRNCAPVQDNISSLMQTFPKYAIKVPIFHLNLRYYGTDYISIFPITIQDFLNTNKLKLNHTSNDTFSFLYIHNHELKSYSQISNSKVICTLTNNQVYLENEIRSLSLKTFEQLNYFLDLYKIQTRNKRSNFFTDMLGNAFFSDKQDLNSIHTTFNDYLSHNNHQIYVEKKLFKELKVNEHKILDQLHLQEVSLWYSKFRLLSLAKLESQNTNNLLFISSLNSLSAELADLKSLLAQILVKNTSQKICMQNIGCFFNAHVIFDREQIKIELHKIQLVPNVEIMQTCSVYNQSFIYSDHNMLNKHANCSALRPIVSSDYFFEKIVIIVSNTSFSFSCATKKDFYVNEKIFTCKNKPTIFFPSIFSFKLKLDDEDYIIKEIHHKHFLISNNETFGQILYEEHLNINKTDETLTYFNHYLSSVNIHPTALGWILVSGLLLVISAIGLLLCYLFNSSLSNLIAICKCCKGASKKTIIVIESEAKTQDEDSQSLNSFHNLTSFVQ